MAATQRPITEAALNEAADEPAWKTIPSWFIYGDQDRNIPRCGAGFHGEAGRGEEILAIAGASHVVMLSHPHEVARLIEAAAAATRPTS